MLILNKIGGNLAIKFGPTLIKILPDFEKKFQKNLANISENFEKIVRC